LRSLNIGVYAPTRRSATALAISRRGFIPMDRGRRGGGAGQGGQGGSGDAGWND